MADTPPAAENELTLEQVEKVREVLRGLPELDKGRRVITRGEAVKLLKGELEDLRKRGYSVREIAAVLTTNGLRISKPTLWAHLRTTKEQTGPKKVKRKKPMNVGGNRAAEQGSTSNDGDSTSGRASTQFRPPDETPKSEL